MSNDKSAQLGPLAWLAGVWEGDKGSDFAPGDDRGSETNLFRERITFDPLGPVDNHEQQLFGLRYTTTVWRIGAADPFHEEVGYWLWDATAKQVYRCFIVPRGVTVIAGGDVEPTARRMTLVAAVGSPTFGICSNPFLDREFRTERYTVTIEQLADGSFHYAEDTELRMPGKPELFHHTDSNTLRRILAGAERAALP